MNTQPTHHGDRAAARRESARLLAAAVTLVLTCYAALAQIPGTVDYRGYLTDDAGVPLSGTVGVEFRLYADETGGAPLWQESQGGIPVQAGRFDVKLGSVTPLLADPDIEGFDRTLYLGLSVNGGAELTPRLPLPGSVFALATVPTPLGRTSVDCTAGESITQAMDQAPAGGRYVIEITGDCRENLYITRDRLTLQAAGGVGTARLLSVSPSTETFGYGMYVGGARGVVLDGLIVEPDPDGAGTDPARGILATDNVSLLLTNGTTVRGYSTDGIVILENTFLEIDTATVENNGRDGIQVVDGSSLEANDADIRNNGDDGLNLYNGSTAALTNSRITGNVRYAVVATVGSAINLEGDVILENNRAGIATIGLFDKGTLRATGTGNRISNLLNVPYGEATTYSESSMAIDAQRVSTARIDRGFTQIDGWVYVFNHSTIDLRTAEINGVLSIDGGFANIRLQNQGGGIVNGAVRIRSGTFTTKVAPDPEAVIINGIIDCSGVGFAPRADFQDADDGYINCANIEADTGVTLLDSVSPGTVQVGNVVTYTATFDNPTSAPTVEISNLNLEFTVNGPAYTIDDIRVPGATCESFGGPIPSGTINGELQFNCFIGDFAPGSLVSEVDIIPDAPGFVDVTFGTSQRNPDPNDTNDDEIVSTEAVP